jgi:phage-related baseplate assembly protein
VAVLSADGNGEPSGELLQRVEAALMSDDVRVVSDHFNVLSAIRRTIDVSVSVRLGPHDPEEVVDEVRSQIVNKWQEQDLLGLDLTRAFLVRVAGSVSGITNVEIKEPFEDVVADQNEAIGLGSVTVNISGRGR